MLWRSQKKKSRSVPEGRADFPAAIFLAGKCPTLAGIALRAAGTSVKNFPASSKIAGKLLQQGILDGHSLLEFSDGNILYIQKDGFILQPTFAKLCS